MALSLVYAAKVPTISKLKTQTQYSTQRSGTKSSLWKVMKEKENKNPSLNTVNVKPLVSELNNKKNQTTFKGKFTDKRSKNSSSVKGSKKETTAFIK